jgi:hypothetical protein
MKRTQDQINQMTKQEKIDAAIATIRKQYTSGELTFERFDRAFNNIERAAKMMGCEFNHTRRENEVRYTEACGTVEAEDGTEIKMTVQHVNIDPERARAIFETGHDEGDWGWKHKSWYCRDEQELRETQAAARFYYGWKDGSEKITPIGTGAFWYDARYAC